MPSVPSEERIPSGAIIFIAVILAVVCYGVWQYSVSEDKSVVEMIKVIPDRVMEFIADVIHDGEGAEVMPTGDNTPDSTLDAAFSPPPLSLLAPSSASETQTEAMPTPTPPTDTTVASASSVSVPETSPLRPSSSSTALMTGVALSPSTVPTPPVENTQNVTTKPPAVSTDTSPMMASTPAPEELATSASAVPADVPAFSTQENAAATGMPVSADTPAIPETEALSEIPSVSEVTFGDNNVGGRVIVRATTAQVWMRVFDESNQIIFERTLNPGESYRAPNYPGLKLRVGNAPAVEVLVDGKLSQVVRSSRSLIYTVSLDPDGLAALNTP